MKGFLRKSWRGQWKLCIANFLFFFIDIDLNSLRHINDGNGRLLPPRFLSTYNRTSGSEAAQMLAAQHYDLSTNATVLLHAVLLLSCKSILHVQCIPNVPIAGNEFAFFQILILRAPARKFSISYQYYNRVTQDLDRFTFDSHKA